MTTILAEEDSAISAAQKSPRLAPGALFSSRKRCLSPYRNAGLSIRRAKLIHANALGGGRNYQFHPDGIRTLEIRSLGRLAQGVDAVLLPPGGRVGETRQLEHNPGVFGHFGQADRNFRSFRLHTDFGTGAHSAL